MPSLMGYAQRHSAHFRLSGFAFSVSGFLHAGQTRISSRSWGIMCTILAPSPRSRNRTAKKTVATVSRRQNRRCLAQFAESDGFGYNCIVPRIHKWFHG